MSEVPTAVFFVNFASALEETLHRNIGTDRAHALQSEEMDGLEHEFEKPASSSIEIRTSEFRMITPRKFGSLLNSLKGITLDAILHDGYEQVLTSIYYATASDRKLRCRNKGEDAKP
jgi:hypothetical protein